MPPGGCCNGMLARSSFQTPVAAGPNWRGAILRQPYIQPERSVQHILSPTGPPCLRPNRAPSRSSSASAPADPRRSESAHCPSGVTGFSSVWISWNSAAAAHARRTPETTPRAGRQHIRGPDNGEERTREAVYPLSDHDVRVGQGNPQTPRCRWPSDRGPNWRWTARTHACRRCVGRLSRSISARVPYRAPTSPTAPRQPGSRDCGPRN